MMADPAALGPIGWGAIQAALAVGVPVVGAIVTVVLWLHRRIKSLEDKDAKRQGAGRLFGDSDSPLSIGLAKEMRDVKNEQSELKEEVAEIHDSIDDIHKELNKLNEDD
jgi:hypothetical protein